MGRFSWSRLTKQQVGRYAEYFVKMEFTLYGFEVYTAEVDDRGIDFVARQDRSTFFIVQVKAVRDLNYVFMHKSKFATDKTSLLALVLLMEDTPPEVFLIPDDAWLAPNTLLVGHDYEGLKSKPEWGINLSQRNLPLLHAFRFDSVIHSLTGTSMA